MKNKNNAQSQVIPVGCFIILLLNLNLDCNRLFASGYSTERTHLWLSSATGLKADSSGNDLLSLNYILNTKQLLNEEALQVESWMIQPDIYQNSNTTDIDFNSSIIEEEVSTEDWMLKPGLFINNGNPDPIGDEVQAEDKISLENWMINTSTWVDIHLCH